MPTYKLRPTDNGLQVWEYDRHGHAVRPVVECPSPILGVFMTELFAAFLNVTPTCQHEEALKAGQFYPAGQCVEGGCVRCALRWVEQAKGNPDQRSKALEVLARHMVQTAAREALEAEHPAAYLRLQRALDALHGAKP